MDKDKKETKEIDVIVLIKEIFKHKITLGICVAVFTVIGIIVSLSIPKSYTSEVILAPEISSGGLALNSSIADMASSFGIDLDKKSSIDAIYPEIYPALMTSNDFIILLLNIPVEQNNTKTKKTYYQHLIQDAKIPIWEKFFKRKDKKRTSNINAFHLTKEQENIINSIRANLSCIVDKKTSLITISVTDQDPQVAAILADTLQQRLQNYITIYRTKKAKKDVNYYNKLFIESKNAYQKAQQTYAVYSDANEDAVLQSIESKRDELENEMQLKFNIYNQMATQLQTAEAKVQENTPAFTIIEHATVPHKASSTPRTLIVIIFMIIGITVDIIWIIYKNKCALN